MPRISIIMPAFNAATTIEHAIRSVQHQSVPAWSLTVVDDGCTDSTADVVAAIAADDARIHLLRQENQGVSAARNRAVRHTDADLVTQLDADDALEPSYLARVTRAFADCPDLSLCCVDAFTFKQPGRAIGRRSANRAMVPPVTPDRVISRDFQIHTAATFRSGVFEAVGGYDPSLHAAEDLDLWIRILIAGGTAYYIDAPLAWYRVGKGASLSADAVDLMEQEIRVHRKILRTDCPWHEVARRRIDHLMHLIAVARAKSALFGGQYDEFFTQTQRASDFGRNRKLSAATALARISPPLARFVAYRITQ